MVGALMAGRSPLEPWSSVYTMSRRRPSVPTGPAPPCRALRLRPQPAVLHSRPVIFQEVRAIIEILKNTWRRLTHKQFLALYPFVLGIVNVLAFLAIYSSIETGLSLDGFVRANFERWSFIQEHVNELLTPGLPLAITLAAGVGVCLLAAALRAPYFRAVAGTGYPLAPRSFGELLRLGAYYAVTYVLFFVVPYSLPADSAAFRAVGIAVIPASMLFLFGDYAVVFDGFGPWAAVKRSVSLLRRAWLPAIIFYLVALVLWSLLAELYGRYYEGGAQIFVLLPLAQLLIEALITTLLDVLLIMTYQRYRG